VAEPETWIDNDQIHTQRYGEVPPKAQLYWLSEVRNHSRKQEKIAKIITSQSKKISNTQKRFLKAIFPKNWMKENRKIMHKNVNYKSNIHKNGNA